MDQSTIYKPLRTEEPEIRLLEIVPDEDRTKLCFHLHHVLLKEAPNFWALSYAWGKSGDTWPIFVNGSLVWINENLRRILRDRLHVLNFFRRKPRSRREFECPYVWVDAICINQLDLEERSKQVLLMGKIYHKAMVAVCLDGGETEISRTAAVVLVDLPLKDDAGEELIIPSESWRALYRFFTKGWFTRMWVVQEFVLPKLHACDIWLDNYNLDTFNLWKAANILFRMEPAGLSPSEKISMRTGMRQYLSLFEIRLETNMRPSLDPMFVTALLWIFQDRLVTDPRDKIYSLLGIFKGNSDASQAFPEGNLPCFDRDRLIVDYHVNVGDVYASLVDAVVSGTNSLNIICASQHPSSFSRSWIPDWAEPWQRYSFLTSSIYKTYHHLEDCGEPELYCASASKPASFLFSHDRLNLSVWGIQWDRISYLHDPAPFPPQDSWETMRWSHSIFDKLHPELQKRLAAESRRFIPDRTGPQSAKLELYLASMGGLFVRNRSRGLDYRGYYPGASAQWHDYSALFCTGEVLDDEFPNSDSGELDVRCHQVGYRRKIFVSERGHCGLVPDYTKPGDFLCVLFGCDVPVVLRKRGPDTFTFIGESYIQRLMYGEAIEALEQGKVVSVKFDLV